MESNSLWSLIIFFCNIFYLFMSAKIWDLIEVTEVHSVASRGRWSEYSHFSVKGGFFSESEIRFSNLRISQKNYSKKIPWAWNLNKLFTDMGGNFKFQAQDSFFGIIFLGDWEIWKTNLTFWKKGTFNVGAIAGKNAHV